MYDELYAAWRKEVDEATLGTLPPDFYVRTADYVRRIREEDRSTDKKSVKAVLALALSLTIAAIVAIVLYYWLMR